MHIKTYTLLNSAIILELQGGTYMPFKPLSSLFCGYTTLDEALTVGQGAKCTQDSRPA